MKMAKVALWYKDRENNTKRISAGNYDEQQAFVAVRWLFQCGFRIRGSTECVPPTRIISADLVEVDDARWGADEERVAVALGP